VVRCPASERTIVPFRSGIVQRLKPDPIYRILVRMGLPVVEPVRAALDRTGSGCVGCCARWRHITRTGPYLLTPCVMDFRHPLTGRKENPLLEPRSLFC
jgi:hypothetical protein